MTRIERAPRPEGSAHIHSAVSLIGCWLAVAALLGCTDAKHSDVTIVSAEPAASQAPMPAQTETRVTLIMKTLTNPFFVEMERGARKAQQETRIDLQVRTATLETSIEQQIQLVDDAVKGKSRAIVIAPGDSTRLVPALKKAQDAGIVLVNIDNRLNADAVAAAGMRPVPFISVDNEKGAYLASRFIADRVSMPTEAAVIEGLRTADNAQQRKRGAERGFHANRHIRIVAEESANWKIDEAYAVTARIFKQHPKVKLLFCANDMMAIGAIKYLQETGQTQVLVAGFDALAEVMPAIRAGQLAVTVDQQAAEQGYLGVKTALKLLAGEDPPMDIQVDSKLVSLQSLK
jgi:ribose transport system substrate-binding protein